MNKKLLIMIVVIGSLILMTHYKNEVIAANVKSDPVVDIPDTTLKENINTTLGQAPSADITESQMLTIKKVDEQSNAICNLKGIEYAKNLEVIDTTHGLACTAKEVDLSPLEGLTSLEIFRFPRHTVKNTDKLSKLLNLRELDLSKTGIDNVEFVRDYRYLNTLEVANNNISDLSPLEKVMSLDVIFASNNNISDLSPLKDLKFANIDLAHNKIKDVSILANKPRLIYLELGYNEIEDLRPLSGLKLVIPKAEHQNIVVDYNGKEVDTMPIVKVYDFYGNEHVIDLGTLNVGIEDYSGTWDDGDKFTGDYTLKNVAYKVTPLVPIDPSIPVTPSKPMVPLDPSTPIVPGKPTPDIPTDPSNPIVPEKPLEKESKNKLIQTGKSYFIFNYIFVILGTYVLIRKTSRI